MRSIICTGLLLTIVTGGSASITQISINTTVVATTQHGFVGATIDWWRDNDPIYGPKFGHAGALTLNLEAPGLIAAASALAPGILRIGGTPADGIVYEVRGGECASVPNKPEPTCVPNKGYSCDKCGDKYGCLIFDRWRELLLFANTTGMRLVFGLNGCRGRRSADAAMDWSNIVDLLNRTVAEGLGSMVAGLELGNELIKGYVTPERMAKDFIFLHNITSSLWGHAGLQPPFIAGADELRNMDVFLAHLPSTVLAAATFHLYGSCGHDPRHNHSFPNVSAPGFALQPACLSREEDIVSAMAVVRGHPDTQGIVGESALTGGGGADGVTNAFVSSMWYADWLAFAAKSGVSAVLRETLVGGYYGLLNHSTLMPHPDTFAMALFNRLMGPRVLSTRVQRGPDNATTMLRVYAHCHKGPTPGVTVLLVNLASEAAFSVRLSLAHSAKQVWRLQGAGGDIHAKTATLNGVPLAQAPGARVLPAMPGAPLPADSPVSVPRASVTFVLLAGEDAAAACS